MRRRFTEEIGKALMGDALWMRGWEMWLTKEEWELVFVASGVLGEKLNPFDGAPHVYKQAVAYLEEHGYEFEAVEMFDGEIHLTKRMPVGIYDGPTWEMCWTNEIYILGSLPAQFKPPPGTEMWFPTPDYLELGERAFQYARERVPESEELLDLTREMLRSAREALKQRVAEGPDREMLARQRELARRMSESFRDSDVRDRLQTMLGLKDVGSEVVH